MALQGKVAIITASTKGVGFAIAKRFVTDGCNVVVSSRKQQHVDEAVEQLQKASQSSNSNGQVIGTLCDVLQIEDLQKLVDLTVQKFGKIDILVVNTAGNNTLGQQIMQISDEEWDAAFTENVKPARHLSRLVLPHMKQQNNGSIVLVGSIMAYTYPDQMGLYPVAKATLAASMKAIAGQVGQFGIRCNCVVPGIIESNFTEPIRADEAWIRRVVLNTAMGRLGSTWDVAGVALFLASDYSSFVTGESVVVAGGSTVSHF